MADSGIWIRGAVLFLGLAIVKLGLLWEFRTHLSQVHWRTRSLELGIAEHIAFYAFVILLVGAILLLGRRCEAEGVRAVRTATLSLLGLSALFIFLTFHEGNKNYLYPVQIGVLDWSDLGAYLSLNLFFRSPFLAAWIFVYGLVYWVLARSGLERKALKVTAGFAGVYALMHLRHLPAVQAGSSDLLIVVTVGAISLFAAWWSRVSLTIAWYPLVLGWCAAVWFTLTSSSSEQGGALTHFLVPAAFILAAFLAVDLLARKAGFHKPWSNLAPFFVTTFILLGVNHYPGAANHHAVLEVAFSAGRYFAGEFLLACGVLAAAGFWRRMRPRGSLILFDIVCVLLVVAAIIDLKLAQVMGTRLDWSLLRFGDSPVMMWRLAKPYLPGLAGAVLLVVAVYGAGTMLLRKSKLQELIWPSSPGQRGSLYLVLAATGLLAIVGFYRVAPDKALGESILRVAASSPLMRSVTSPPMSPDEFQQEVRALGLPFLSQDEVRDPLAEDQDPLNVILILLESTFNEHLSLFGSDAATQPLLSQYQDRMELFPNFFCNYMGSIHARFACFAGLYPIHNYNQFTIQRVPVKSSFEIFKEQGYHCSMFYSSFFDYTSFRDLLRGRGLEEMFDADTMPGERHAMPVSWGLQETETLGAIKARLETHGRDGDRFFLTYIPACPHNPFDAIPERFRKHKPIVMGDHTPRFLNSLLYMDWVVAEILKTVEDNGLLEHTLIVITGDHGEMLGADGGSVGHGWAVTAELANVPLIVLNPRRPGYRVNPTVGSHVDLLPTMASLAGVPLPEGELYQGHPLNRPSPEGRITYINSNGQYGMIQDDLLVVGDRIQDAADPGHRTAWRFSNEGADTQFDPISAPVASAVSIERFDRFQSAFLRHYEMHKKAVAPARSETVRPVAQTGLR